MSKKAWIIFASVCFALLVVLVYISSKDKVDVSGVNVNAIQAASQQSGSIADHVFGKADSKVLFVEYGDYQCPGCGNAYPNVKTVTDKYQGQIAFVFRNFPLTALHPNAKAAAAAAEAAGLQGKYWQMHDKLYENQSSWENLNATDRATFFEGYAKDFGLNVTQFTNDMGSQKVTQKINFDIALGQKANINATPSFFLDGKPLDSNVWGTAATLDTAVAQELKANNIALPAAAN